MKPIINVAMTVLLSLGMVACSGGGGGASNADNRPHSEQLVPQADSQSEPSSPTPITPNQQENLSTWLANALGNKDYVHANDPNKEVITLESRGSKKNYTGKYGTVTVERETETFIEIGASPRNDSYTDINHTPLDATYFGKIFLGDADKHTEIESRSVVFNLKDKHISGHSIKTTQNDLQVIFEKAATGKQKTLGKDILGFHGNIDVKKNGQDFGTGTYTGYFAGKSEAPAQEIIGDFTSKIIFGSFLAEKQPETVTPNKP